MKFTGHIDMSELKRSRSKTGALLTYNLDWRDGLGFIHDPLCSMWVVGPVYVSYAAPE